MSIPNNRVFPSTQPTTGYSFGQQLFTPPHNMSHNQQLTAHVTHDGDSDSEEGEEDECPRKLSEIHLKISAPLLVQGNGNLVSIDTAANATKISLGVVSALRQITSASGGVPMIDEDGRPRPIKIDITAEVRVHGSCNVVGEKAILAKTVVGGEIRKVDVKQEGGPAAERVGEKRERAGSEPAEMDSKKVRRD
jgi:hypothetical protein